MVAKKFSPMVGGAAIQAERLSAMLAQKGIEIEVITPHHHGLKSYEEINGVKVRRVRTPGLGTLKRITRTAHIFHAILKYCNNFDVLHIHSGLETAYAGVRASKYLKKPCIVRLGGTGQRFQLNRFVRKSPFRFGRIMASYIAKNTARFVTLKEDVRVDLRQWGVNESKIVNIPNGVPLYPQISPEKSIEFRKKLELPLDKRIILCVGRLSLNKNQTTIIGAFSRMCKNGLNASLVFLGNGIMRNELEHQSLKSGFKDRIIFKGWVDDVLEYLYASDVFVLPSIVEAFSNALLEAMSVGIPCVVSNVPGNRILVKEEANGLVFDPLNARELANVLERILKEKELANQLGKNARELIHERYSMQSVAQQFIDLYDSLIQENPRMGRTHRYEA